MTTEGSLGSEEEISSNVECFQNFTAPEVFVQGLAGQVSQHDVASIIRSQKYMLQRFEKTNEMLVNCNELSIARLQNASLEFKRHSQMLIEMKKDVDYILRKIKGIKAKLVIQYPDAFKIATEKIKSEINDDDEDDEDVDKPEASPDKESSVSSVLDPPSSSS